MTRPKSGLTASTKQMLRYPGTLLPVGCTVAEAKRSLDLMEQVERAKAGPQGRTLTVGESSDLFLLAGQMAVEVGVEGGTRVLVGAELWEWAGRNRIGPRDEAEVGG